MTFLKWIIGVPLVIGAIAFAVANGDLVLFTWSPLHDPLEWPLYALVLAALSIGFVIGSLMTWAAAHAVRKERRAQAKTIKTMQQEIDKLTETQARHETLQIARHQLTQDEVY